MEKKWADITPYATLLMEILSPYCTLLCTAGSYARMCPTVGDLELVALLPKENRTKAGMALMEVARICKGTFNATARYVCLSLKENSLQVDLFLPTETDFYRQLAIRTGPAEYSKRIAVAWVKMGWVGTSEGLRLREECKETKSGWEPLNLVSPTLPPAWKGEPDFFEWLGMPYVLLKERI